MNSNILLVFGIFYIVIGIVLFYREFFGENEQHYYVIGVLWPLWIVVLIAGWIVEKGVLVFSFFIRGEKKK